MKNYSTSLKISAPLEHQMLRKIVDDGYGLKGKSKWVNEAITGFLRLPNFAELVDIADEIDNLNKVLSFRITEQLRDEIDNGVVTVRQQFPSLEGVKSKICRASILQRLLQNSFAK